MACPVSGKSLADLAAAEEHHSEKTADSMEKGQPETIYYSPVAEPGPEMRKIVAEVCSLGPGNAAILLQIASKPVGLGVAAHRGFSLRPLTRARRTFNYIYVMTFGTPEERKRITDVTNRVHSQVKTDEYDADDVDEQLWVAATLYWSFVTGYEAVYGKLDDERADKVYQESSVMATGLKVPPERWPKDREAFQIYWDESIKKLEVTDAAREVAREVLWPVGFVPLAFKPMFATMGWLFRSLTIEFLPEEMQRDFGLPSTKFSRTTHKVFYKTNRVIYPFTPRPLRHMLKDVYMTDFRYRVKRGKRL